MTKTFPDTNILAYQCDSADIKKQQRAYEVVQDTSLTFIISTQVLLELDTVLTRKVYPAFPSAVAQEIIAGYAELPVVATDPQLVLRAVATAGRHQLSIGDAMIVEAAVEAGCSHLWSEDLAHGSRLQGVDIVNPFE